MSQVQYTSNSNPDTGNLSRASLIPTNILEANKISTTSHAIICFTKQGFSAKLQAFLITYVSSISGFYSVYK